MKRFLDNCCPPLFDNSRHGSESNLTSLYVFSNSFPLDDLLYQQGSLFPRKYLLVIYIVLIKFPDSRDHYQNKFKKTFCLNISCLNFDPLLW